MQYSCAGAGIWYGDDTPPAVNNCSVRFKESTGQIYKLVGAAWVEIVPVGVTDKIKTYGGQVLVIENGLIVAIE